MSYDTSDSDVEVASIDEIEDFLYKNGPVESSDESVTSRHDAFAPDFLLPYSKWARPSPWSRSAVKRVFDCSCVLFTVPFWIPILCLVALAVRATSRGPIFFLQQRLGRDGRGFIILKFRTMVHARKFAHHPVTTSGNQRFTPIGPFLRRWKLDELPQVLNVLIGHMSLVGPRPKLPEHTMTNLPCRPGITGAATIAFAREESELAQLPQNQLDRIYHSLVLPAKHNMDVEYMAKATLLSDLKLISMSIARRWDRSFLLRLVGSEDIRRQIAAGASTDGSKAQKTRHVEWTRHSTTARISVEESASV